MKKRNIQAKKAKGKTQWWKHLRKYMKRQVSKQVRKFWKQEIK